MAAAADGGGAPACRICFEDARAPGELIAPCRCKGAVPGRPCVVLEVWCGAIRGAFGEAGRRGGRPELWC